MNKAVFLTCIITLFTAFFSADLHAKYTKRDGRWEASLQMVNSQSADVSGENGSALALDSDLGWGLSLGYNYNNHLLVNFEFTSVTPDYKAALIEDDGDVYTVDHKMNVYQTQFNAVYNFMAQQFTPFVQAGAGWSYLDSNIADGPPNSVCWWDPWWGYVCNNYQNTYNDTRFSYNVAAGVRYELDNSMFFRASYQQSWIDLSNSEDMSMGMIHLEVGSIF
jgi:opacity protein-like surface antigen